MLVAPDGFAATNADLPAMAKTGEFRADLLDRLAFDVITLPPLRLRTGDATLLADFFARRMAIEMAEDFPGFAPSAIASIEAHDWPGNVRELRNFAQRLAYRAILQAPNDPVQFDPGALDPFDSPWRPTPMSAPVPETKSANPPAHPQPGLPLDKQVAALEMSCIDSALQTHQGHQGKAAKSLGLTYHQFRGLLRKHGYGKRAGKAA